MVDEEDNNVFASIKVTKERMETDSSKSTTIEVQGKNLNETHKHFDKIKDEMIE